MIATFNRTYDIKSLTLNGLTAVFQRNGYPAYRAKQVFDWVFKKGVRSFDEMTNVPKELRSFLKEVFSLNSCDIEKVTTSSDGTQKILLRLADGQFVESVLMPDGDRYTLCLSSQVGCALNCSFCLTGKMGLRRDLAVAEMVDQVLIGRRVLGDDGLLTNLVFMGMGEPLLNLGNLIPALRLIVSPQSIGISTRRVTVSTAGIPDGICKLGQADLGINLAVSLNATTNTIRDTIMPINRKFPINTILDVCRDFPLTKRRLITFEYVLLREINDSLDDAKRLAKLVKGISCKINVILLNTHPLIPFTRSKEETVETFCEYLRSKHFRVSVRYSKGGDICAACGQLAGNMAPR